MRRNIAIAAIVFNEMHYLLEWIGFHLVMGVDGFLIYDNESTDGTSAMLKALSSSYPIEVKSWPRLSYRSAQIDAYNDALSRAKNEYKFLALIDADEFLFCRDYTSLTKVIETVHHSTGAIAINQIVFGSSGEMKYQPGLVIDRFVWRSKLMYEENRFFKSIASTDLVLDMESSHSVRLKSGSYQHSDGRAVEFDDCMAGRSKQIVLEPLRLHHYILKSYEEFQRKKSRGGAASWTASERASRYNDEFFSNRERYLNQEYDPGLQAISQRVFLKKEELKAVLARSNTSGE